MPQNFLACDREQTFLMPPDVREWLPEGHLAWFVIDAVARMELAPFYGAYRQDGHGRAAFDPAMMVALLLYAYAIGERSSRHIERRCIEDVATRVICANQAPDHTTISRFRQRHETALAGLFGEVLALCAEAGLVQVGVIAIDGTKVHANASERATRDYEQIAREILAEADAVEREATSYLSSSRPAPGARSGWPRRSAASSGSVPRRPGRSPPRARSGCGNPSAAWKRSSRRSVARMRPMRPTARAG